MNRRTPLVLAEPLSARALRRQAERWRDAPPIWQLLVLTALHDDGAVPPELWNPDPFPPTVPDPWDPASVSTVHVQPA